MRRLAFVVFFASLLAGCGDSDENRGRSLPATASQTTAGSLAGLGSFTYKCASPSDSFCSDNSLFGPGIPQLAVGAEALLSFKTSNGEDRSVTISASPDRVRLDAGRVALLREGTAAVFATESGGEIVDGYNLVASTKSATRLQALGGGLIGFRVFSVDRAGKVLAGSIPCTWTVDDPAVAVITTDPSSTVVLLDLKANGKTSLRVTYGDFKEVIPVEVNR
jgi:hypothetical protein